VYSQDLHRPQLGRKIINHDVFAVLSFILAFFPALFALVLVTSLYALSGVSRTAFLGRVKINYTLFFASYNIVFTVQPLLCVSAHKNNDLIYVRNSQVRGSILFFRYTSCFDFQNGRMTRIFLKRYNR